MVLQNKTKRNIIRIGHKFLITHAEYIVGGLENSLFNLMSHQRDIDNIYLYVKDSREAMYELLINKRESTGLENLNGSKAFIEYSSDKDDIYKNIEEYNRNKKNKILIVSGVMIADMLSTK